MKKIYLLLSLSILAICGYAQVTTEPAIITEGYTGQIKIIFDPTAGNGGMESATECYAHTAVTTNTAAWQCAPTWRDGTNEMTQENGNWVMTIDNMYDFYSCASGTFEKLMFVFNDGPGGTNEGKAAGDEDIEVAVLPPGLSVAFSGTSSEGTVDANSTITMTINSTVAADLEILKDGQVVESASSATELTYTGSIGSAAGDFVFTGKASSGGDVVTDTRTVSVIGGPVDETRPNGIDEGIYYNEAGTEATLSIYAANRNGDAANSVFIIGDFNDWTKSNAYQLKKDGNHFWITISGLTPGEEYAFQYLVERSDGVTKQISDPYSTKVLHADDKWEPKSINPDLMDYPNGKGDGYVSVLQPGAPEFNWSSATVNFDRPDRNNLIIYEMWVYDFSPDRSFDGVTKRLDYLENLGVNAIELLPVNEFEGNMSWGYNPTHYMAIDRAYGSQTDFKELVDEAHKRGIAVILDIAMNHATGQNPQNKLYPYGTDLSSNPYFNTSAPHSASVFEDWDHGFSGTKKYFSTVMTYLTSEYKVDGFRLDLSHGLCGLSCSDRVGHIFDYFNAAKAGGGDDIYYLLEHWEGDGGELSNYSNNGMAPWLNNAHSYEQTAMGWLENGDGLDASNVDGYISYCESHDEERTMFKASEYGNGSLSGDESERIRRSTLNVAFNTMLNGPHMFWQFAEMGYDYSIEYNGKTGTKPQPENLGWYGDAERMAAYQKLGQIQQLRTKLSESVFEGNPTSSDLGSGKSLRSIIWGSGDDRIFIIGNFNVASGSSYSGAESFSLPSGNDWYDYLADGTSAMGAGTNLTLEAGEIKVYTAKRIALPEVPNSYDFTVGISSLATVNSLANVYPNITHDIVNIETEENVRSIQMMALSGQVFDVPVMNKQVNLSALPNGLYLMILNYDGGQEAKKIVKY